MEKIKVNESNNLFNTSSFLNANHNQQGIAYVSYLKNKINNQNKIENNVASSNQNKNIPFSFNMNSLYFNMLRYNFINNNYKPYNTNTRIILILYFLILMIN